MLGKTRLLKAIGHQDKYLTDCPQLSFFKTTPTRHTNFCRHTTPVEPSHFNNGDLTEPQYRFGERVNFRLGGTGDLLSDIHLELTLVGDDWVDSGKVVPETIFALIDSIELRVGNIILQKLTGTWMYTHHQLRSTSAQKTHVENMAYASSTRNATGTVQPKSGGPLQTVYTLHFTIPFYFHKRSHLALPLLALSNEQVAIDVTLKPLKRIAIPTFTGYIGKILLIGDFIELENVEKESYLKQPLEYVIEQVNADTELIPMNHTFSRKVEIPETPFLKQIVWAVQTCLHTTDSLKQYFNFNYELNVSQTKNSHFQRSRLILNGKSYESQKLDSKFYEQVQRFEFATGVNNRCLYRDAVSNAPNAVFSQYCPNAIYSHSLSMHPESIEPSGFLNLEKFNTAHLDVRCTPSTSHKRELHIFTIQYNLIRIQKGHLDIVARS